MNEPHVAAFISSYLDNELDTETKQKVESHIFTCRTCLKDYEDLLMVKVQLGQSYSDTEPSSNLENQVMAAIGTGQTQAQKSTRALPFLAPAFLVIGMVILAFAFPPSIWVMV